MNLIKDTKNLDRLKQDLDTLQRTINDLQTLVTQQAAAIAALQASTTRVVIQPNSNVTTNNKGFFTGVVVQPGTGLSGKGTNASPLAGSQGISPDGVTIKQQVVQNGAFDSALFRVPINLGTWMWGTSAAAGTPLIFTTGGCTGMTSGGTNSADLLWGTSGMPYVTKTAAISGGTASIANASQTMRPLTASGQFMEWIYRFGFNAASTTSSLADTRLRMGCYGGTLSTAAQLQSNFGSGIRYCFEDGTSPSKWVLEQYDGVTRTTSAGFGTVVLAHEYRIVLKWVNASGTVTMNAEVWDITAGTVSTSSLVLSNSTLTGSSGCGQMGAIAFINTNASQQRTINYATFAAYVSPF